jgi:hypothetical protein
MDPVSSAVSQSSKEFGAVMSELHDISLRAQHLSATVEEIVGGSATGVDRKLIEALLTLAHSTSKAAHAIASLPKID